MKLSEKNKPYEQHKLKATVKSSVDINSKPRLHCLCNYSFYDKGIQEFSVVKISMCFLTVNRHNRDPIILLLNIFTAAHYSAEA